MNWMAIAVALGAILGALSRYYLTLFSIEKWGKRFPIGTLLINSTGAFLIGLISCLIPQNQILILLQKTIIIGFLGAYTTFSSYILESANLWSRSQPIVAISYWLGSPILGFFSIKLGIWIAQHLN